MTQQTFSTDKFIEELEAWETETSNQACFPKVNYCPFEAEQGDGITNMLCGHCPFASHNRKQFINTLKTIKLLELDHVAIPKTPEANEGGK
jgi:hypothetical protein